MAYCNHPYDTQTNEALNQSIATVAPKNTCYSGTISLYSRINLVIGIHNLGYRQLFDALFQHHNMLMTPYLSQYLERKEERKGMKRKYERRLDVKMARSQKQKKSRQDVFNERTDNSYGAGVGLNAGIKKKSTTKTVSGDKKKEQQRCKCGSDTHLRTTHRDCPLKKVKSRIMKEGQPIPATDGAAGNYENVRVDTPAAQHPPDVPAVAWKLTST